MAQLNITEGLIREYSSSASYQKGQAYVRRGAVSDLNQRGNTGSAKVEGSEYQPYRVRISLQSSRDITL